MCVNWLNHYFLKMPHNIWSQTHLYDYTQTYGALKQLVQRGLSFLVKIHLPEVVAFLLADWLKTQVV